MYIVYSNDISSNFTEVLWFVCVNNIKQSPGVTSSSSIQKLPHLSVHHQNWHFGPKLLIASPGGLNWSQSTQSTPVWGPHNSGAWTRPYTAASSHIKDESLAGFHCLRRVSSSDFRLELSARTFGSHNDDKDFYELHIHDFLYQDPQKCKPLASGHERSTDCFRMS